MAVVCHLFVVGYEEPTLRRRFGAVHDEYRRTVQRHDSPYVGAIIFDSTGLVRAVGAYLLGALIVWSSHSGSPVRAGRDPAQAISVGVTG